MTASLGEDLRRTPGLTLRPVVSSVMQWVAFVDQWIRNLRGTTGGCASRQPRDRPAGDQPGRDARTLVAHELHHSNTFDFFLAPPPPQYDRAHAKKLLAEADIRTD